jgi:CheY-like chemotaxis protein
MGKRPRVLCVDDQIINLKVRAMLLEQFGCEVLTAEDHTGTLKIVTEAPVDILFIDYHLADGATGEEVARDVRMLRPEIPLVMLTGDVRIPESAQAVVDAVLLKGASKPGDLFEVIRKFVPDAVLRPQHPMLVTDSAKSA